MVWRACGPKLKDGRTLRPFLAGRSSRSYTANRVSGREVGGLRSRALTGTQNGSTARKGHIALMKRVWLTKLGRLAALVAFASTALFVVDGGASVVPAGADPAFTS